MNCLDIITRAMRRIGVLAGGDLPREQETDDALETLKAIYRRLITDGTFGVIHDVTSTGEYVASPNQRVTAGPGATITLPDTARDMAIVCIVDTARNQTDEYIFDGRAKKWTTIDYLTPTSFAPFSTSDPIGLSCYLALELADEYGQQPSQITVQNAARWQMAITHNWSAEPSTVRGVYF
ncbi:hypothetical protein [Sphingomonas faeni]|uniref:hypothetical protein n=1 Tax=Sphingomonas faeni TaxID=185950 RepID=UPI003359C1FF